MTENKIFKKQQWSFTLLNFVVFTLIFALFGLIISTIVKNTLYSKTDEELMNFKGRIEQVQNEEREIGVPSSGNGQPRFGEGLFNPRMVTLKWNEDKEIINQEEIGSDIIAYYFQDLIPDFKQLDTIHNITVDTNTYRTLIFKSNNESSETAYIQLLFNVDAEQSIIENFEKILILCTVLALLLSITASYLLARKTMKPIIQSWNRQLDFVENASHELRTPLTIIQNKLEMLLTVPNARIIDKFENIALSLSETRRLSKLTTDLLTLARADSSETQLVKEWFEADDFVKHVCMPYVEIGELDDKKVQLHLHSNMEIEADKSRIHQLLVILLDNALKYTAEGDEIIVSTNVEDQKLVIEVKDTGIGISEESKKHIFERFFREDKVRTREKGGVGLGLSIAQWIVSSHHGTIQVKSNGNKGTIFKIKLPKKQKF